MNHSSYLNSGSRNSGRLMEDPRGASGSYFLKSYILKSNFNYDGLASASFFNFFVLVLSSVSSASFLNSRRYRVYLSCNLDLLVHLSPLYVFHSNDTLSFLLFPIV